MKIAIVGGGIIGLNTGLQLREQFRDAQISIFASSFENTVSHVAAGIFRVGTSYLGPTEEITKNVINDSYYYYDKISKSPEAASAGITNVSGYIFANSSPYIVKNKWMENLVPIYRAATDEELKLAGDWRYGSFFKTLVVQSTIFLPWARTKLVQSDVSLKEQTINSFNELQDYNLIMNCSGLGARELCDDRRMVAIRGQVIKVKAPWIKTFFYGELDTYIIPNVDGTITLGGCRHFDSERKDVCPYDAAAIRSRCEKMLPSLTQAKTLQHCVGLRPHREGNVRIEIEKNRSLFPFATTVVHNYGHGGYGVCTAPGTVKYAIHLANEAHRLSSKL